MKTNQLGIDLIKSFEGLRLASYQDAVGIWTIGYGSTGPDVVKGMVWTEAQCEERLKSDMAKFEGNVSSYVKVPINSNQFSALVSFCYNVGPGNLQKSTLLKKLNLHDYAGAAEEFLRWNKAGGKELAGLTRRRKAEKDLFLKQEVAAPGVVKSSEGLLPEGPSSEDINDLLKDIEKNILGK